MGVVVGAVVDKAADAAAAAAAAAAEADVADAGAVADLVQDCLEQPHRFLLPDPDLATRFLRAAKWLYGLAKTSEPFEMTPLVELLVDDCDAEQIWEQLQLHNVPMVKLLTKEVDKVISRGDIEANDDDNDSEELGDGDDDDNDSEDDDLDMDDEEDFGTESDAEDVGMTANMKKRAREADSESDNEESDNAEDSEDVGFEGDSDDESDSTRPRGRVTEVDDEFFSLAQMERFAEEGEAKDIARAEGTLSEDDPWKLDAALFEGDPDDLALTDEEDEKPADEIRYEDFFPPPKNTKGGENHVDKKPRKGSVKFNENNEEMEFEKDEPPMEIQQASSSTLEAKKFDLFADSIGETEASGQKLSRFAKEQLDIQQQIDELEKEALAEKAWTLKGEVNARGRPENSLLEEDLEIEHANRPVPVITEETTASLEDMIKSRIRDGLFNDVERKIDTRQPKDFDPNKKPLIDENKSSKSLAEEYEWEYMKKTAGANVSTEKDAELEKAHLAIDGMMKKLYHDLDALSNWHFKPKPVIPELEVTPTPAVPALSMEEVIPAVVSDAVAAAPKEVYAGKVDKSAAEMDSTDRRRARLKKKRTAKKEKAERAKESRPPQQQDGEGAAPVMDKKKALETLKRQSNVTIIGDKKQTGGKKGRGKSGAKTIAAGDTIGEKKAVQSGSMLRL